MFPSEKWPWLMTVAGAYKGTFLKVPITLWCSSYTSTSPGIGLKLVSSWEHILVPFAPCPRLFPSMLLLKVLPQYITSTRVLLSGPASMEPDGTLYGQSVCLAKFLLEVNTQIHLYSDPTPKMPWVLKQQTDVCPCHQSIEFLQFFLVILRTLRYMI